MLKINTKNISKNKITIVQLFSFTICIIMLITAVITYLGMCVLNDLHMTNIQYPIVPFFIFEVISTLAGTFAAILISKKILTPLYSIMDATEKITNGDYTTKVHLNSTYEFQLLSEKFNSMAEELSSVEILRNDFINQFSHEFNTPISSIHGYAKELKQNTLSQEEMDNYLDKIITGTDRLSNLASNVLNLSKIEQQTILTNKNKINITEQIRRVIAMQSFYWERKNISFNFDCNEFFLSGNEEILEHLWSNLLNNAIKYSPLGSTISIEMYETPKDIIIIFTDQGKGITPEALPHIFEKFYRSKSSSLTPGTGLGLTIAHKVVMLHRGTIDVTTELGKGSSFTIALPK